MAIHTVYNVLTDVERSVVDETLDDLIKKLQANNMKFNGSDPIERVAEAIAVFIFEDRPLNNVR